MMDKEAVEALLGRYSIQTDPVPGEPPLGGHLQIEIRLDGAKIGAYPRNYPSLFNTFVPFVQGEQVYALYSTDYTATRVMSLPDCRDLGGEEPHSEGFCPTGYFVPYDPARGLVGHFGFTSGCVWDDDSSWKIEYLDLSHVAQGIVKREARFGYIQLPSHLSLEEAIDLSGYDEEGGEIEFTLMRRYSLTTNKWLQEPGP